MIAVTSPGCAVNDTPVSAGSSAPGYWKVTFWNSTCPRCGRELRLPPAPAGSTISGATSSTSLMRAADADARGSITNMAVTMNTANRICIAYCSDAIIAPTCIVPASIRWLPTQMIAMLVRFSITISAGIRNAIRRFTAIAVFVRSRFAWSNRSR